MMGRLRGSDVRFRLGITGNWDWGFGDTMRVLDWQDMSSVVSRIAGMSHE
jgi:hypothetical protein